MQKDESQISRQARWQRKHRAMGLCVLCSRPAFKGWRCKKHYEQHKITMRLRYIPKVRGRYKVGGSALVETAKRRTTKAKKTAKPAGRKVARTTAKTGRKRTGRKTTTRRTTGKRAARA